VFYFAYGSNLSHAQMKVRCRSSQFLTTGKVYDYKLIFSGFSPRWNSSVANIIPAKGQFVIGAIYSLAEIDLRKLDELEGSQGWTRTLVTAATHEESIDVWTYLSEAENIGLPGEEYTRTIQAGISDCGLEQYSHLILG
jgi:gamma-glutamylcyclotransferase